MRKLLPLLIVLGALQASAATLRVQVNDAAGLPVRDAVVYAVSEERIAPPARGKTAVMDQRDRMFIPYVLPIQTGTAVEFPNSDDVRHHVYSFSPAKPFQLPLYKGNPSSPVVFDKPGVVTLGCNIHDRMSAFIVVVDTPHFAKTAADGSTLIDTLENAIYLVQLWYPDMREKIPPQRIKLDGNATVIFATRRGTGKK